MTLERVAGAFLRSFSEVTRAILHCFSLRTHRTFSLVLFFATEDVLVHFCSRR